MTINVHNMRTCKCEGYRVDRATVLGNPYPVSAHTEQMHNNVVHKYRVFLLRKIDEQDSQICNYLQELLDKYRATGSLTLCCWCSPLPCHADVIKDRILHYFGCGMDFVKKEEE